MDFGESASGAVDIMGALSSLDPAMAATGASPESILQSLGGGFNPTTPSALPSKEISPEELLGVQTDPSAAATNAGSSGSEVVIQDGKVVIDAKRFPNMRASGVVPKVQNVVAMFNVGTKIDLKHIGLHAKNAEYNPKRFAAVIMRIRDPKTTALIFESGKIVVTGAESEDASKKGSKKFAKIILKLGYEAKFKDFKVQNIVGSCGVNFPIRLEMMAADHAMFSSYEPELFPGLIFRMEKPKVVLLIFVSGKIVFTGAKSREEVYQAFENIYPLLVRYDKNRSSRENAPRQ